MSAPKLQRVLHVEDDPSIRAIARVALVSVGGLELMSCADGEEALAQAPEFDPQVLLLDVMMPGIDGPSLLTRLSEHMSLDGRMTLFMTAKVQPADLLAYRGLGAFDVILKPFDAMRLAQNIQMTWRRFHGS
jgi:two-component system, OmpR family, response regulator